MRNIVLIGFMGTGKTSIGRLLANRLGRPFIDSDKKIEHECGMAIRDIFATYGQAFFREKEKNVIAKIARYKNSVIATGGGVVLNPENVSRLRSNGVLITLTASLEVIVERTARRSNRPLLEQADRVKTIAKLLQERAGLYDQGDFIIDTDHNTPQQVVDAILVFLRQGGYLRGRG